MAKHTITLAIGYKDKKGVTHNEIEFGKRLSVEDLINLDSDPQAQNRTQHTDALYRKMMTRFGKLKMLPSLEVFLDLDSIDRQDIAEGANEFLRITRPERELNISKDFEISLRFGFEVEGEALDRCTFGNRITGRDELEAERLGLSAGVAREAFLIGKQIASVSNDKRAIEGAVSLDLMKTLDAEDMNFLRVGAALWRESFRIGREAISGNPGDGNISANAGAENLGNGRNRDDSGAEADISENN